MYIIVTVFLSQKLKSEERNEEITEIGEEVASGNDIKQFSLLWGNICWCWIKLYSEYVGTSIVGKLDM